MLWCTFLNPSLPCRLARVQGPGLAALRGAVWGERPCYKGAQGWWAGMLTLPEPGVGLKAML